MATVFQTVPGFPVFTDNLQGLVQLDAGKPDFTSERYNQMITDFNEKYPGQPSFLIKKESWDFLRQGKNPNNGISWASQNFEVYAFVFCIAFDQKDIPKAETKSKKSKTSGKFSASKPDLTLSAKTFAYFRVRTILKVIGQKVKDGKATVLVETNNIAYVSLEKAFANQNNPGGEQQDCLIFVDENDWDIREKINSEVFRKPKPSESIDLRTKNILEIFITTPKSEAKIIENEGSIFGKQGIWDKILVEKYNLKNDTLISLTWDKQKGTFSFDFKINDEYGTALPCPNPPVCNLE
jgi:hypothetical protein